MSLANNRSISKVFFKDSPTLCTRKKQAKLQETSFCISQKASLTVEAAVVLPITAGFLLTILFFFRVLLVQADVEEALVYAGRTTAVESVLVDEKTTLFLSVEGRFYQAVTQENMVERFVEGGVLGVSLLGSEVTGKEILLKANYMVRFPIEFFGIKGIWLTSQNAFVKWKGDLYTGEIQESWVYITKTGSVYHKNTNCRSLDLNIQETAMKDMDTIRGKNGQKYYSCSKCTDRPDKLEKVYVTDYGKLYHGDLSCSALKRTVEKILISQVGERRPCSYCY